MSQAVPQPTTVLDSDFDVEVLLIRHGRSADVVPGSPESLDPPLAPIGEEQAAAVAARLAAKSIDTIFASDYRRAIQTAAAVAEGRDLEVRIDPDLREVDLGDWENGEYRRRASVRDPEWMVHAQSGLWDDVPGSEGDDALRRRVTAAVDRCIAGCRNQTVAIVCHSGVINAYLAGLWKADRSMVMVIENTSITVVRAGDERRVVVTANDCAHLYDPVYGIHAAGTT